MSVRLATGREMDRWLSARRKRALARHGGERAKRVLFVRTEDDVELALTGYSDSPQRNHPVVLCHGIASNRFTFDIAEERSFARHLVDLGFDVYALELRGHGRSQKARQGSLRFGWGLFSYTWRDLPAALEALYDHTGTRHVHWVGHSMGGIVALAYLGACEMAERDSGLKSLVTAGSALDYSGTASVFHSVRKLARFAPRPGFLGALPAQIFSPLSSALPALQAPFVHPPNVVAEHFARLMAIGVHPICGEVLRDLSTAFEEGGLRDGETRYASMLPGRVPTRALTGTKDLQCNAEAASRVAHETHDFGRAHGHQEDYGHFDLLIGRNAAQETWPVISEWLLQHD